jgi:nucleotide-binding universal stress UspA family protein
VTTIKHILVATDLTDRSEKALERALQVNDGGALTLLHVVTPGLPADLGSRQQGDAEAFLANRVAQISRKVRSHDVEAVVLTGDPLGTIIGQAVTRGADLIVIGEAGTHRYADMFVGTTAERVIRFSDRPVLMVKQVCQGPYSRILVAFDGSEGATRALETALTIAPKGEFRVVHAWWPPRTALGNSEATRQAISDENHRVRALIERAAKQAITSSKSESTKLSIDMIEDNPYLVMRNNSAWPDLLVMGTHSKGRLATTTTIGNLARHMLAEACCDVLVARP